jgi:hypothetical protein
VARVMFLVACLLSSECLGAFGIPQPHHSFVAYRMDGAHLRWCTATPGHGPPGLTP